MRVGTIGDLHAPYELDGYLQFCKETFDAWECDKFVMIGDLVDNHGLNFHDREPELKAANGELIDAIEHLQPWYEAFPELILIRGNHDDLPKRQLKKIGMDPEVWLKNLERVYNMPPGWKYYDEYTIDGVLYHHGYTSMGVNGFRNDAIHRMRKTVSGHCHGNAGVSATASDVALVWGLAVGCGIDRRKMAFAYGRDFKYKPIISCGIVIDGETPCIEFMNLGPYHENT